MICGCRYERRIQKLDYCKYTVLECRAGTLRLEAGNSGLCVYFLSFVFVFFVWFSLGWVGLIWLKSTSTCGPWVAIPYRRWWWGLFCFVLFCPVLFGREGGELMIAMLDVRGGKIPEICGVVAVVVGEGVGM